MATEENILTKSIIAKYIPVADWMNSIILIILGTGTLMGDTMMFKL